MIIKNKLRRLRLTSVESAFPTLGKCPKNNLAWQRRGGLIVSALDFGSSGLGSSPDRGHCVVFLGGDEFPHRLCDPLPPVILFYHVNLQPISGNIKQKSQGVGGHRVYV